MDILNHENIHQRVIEDLVLEARQRVWIATANLKDMHIKAWRGYKPILDEFYEEKGDFIVAGIEYSSMRQQLGRICKELEDSSARIKQIVVDLKDHDGEILYNVATINGIIEESFQATAFLDLTTSTSIALRHLNTDLLSSITFIHACQLYTSFKSADICKCNDDCSTNRCQCKKKNRKWCSKCHVGTDSKCTNC